MSFIPGQGGYESVIHHHKELVESANGFTLLEVLISLTIFSLGLLGLAELQLLGIHYNQRSQNITTAVILAESKIEELKVCGSSGLSSGQDLITRSEGGAGCFHRSWVISQYAGFSHLEQVEVKVLWSERGEDHTICLESVVSEE